MHLSVPAESAVLKVFTPANRLVAHWSLGALPGGESQVALSPGNIPNFANGLYYVVLVVPQDRVFGKWVILRD
jgi:hypothetical protein